ncbi:MAG TPA: ribosomal protein S18-alanine N-acetyltransferase [Candidatus Angelobacter sp.]|nr:ribosomal protein S18-alanine N-acetyltransferase [Candidatus Angelobacter sp.]
MVCVRTAEARDLAALKRIAVESATAAQWNPKEYENLFAHTGHQHRTALVIEQDETLCGFIIGHQIGGEWEIENIAISNSWRHKGLGSCLLAEFLELVRNRGGEQIFLEVRESNHAARALYRKLAFEETGRRKMYYQNPAEDALVLKFKFS